MTGIALGQLQGWRWLLNPSRVAPRSIAGVDVRPRGRRPIHSSRLHHPTLRPSRPVRGSVQVSTFPKLGPENQEYDVARPTFVTLNTST